MGGWLVFSRASRPPGSRTKADGLATRKAKTNVGPFDSSAFTCNVCERILLSCERKGGTQKCEWRAHPGCHPSPGECVIGFTAFAHLSGHDRASLDTSTRWQRTTHNLASSRQYGTSRRGTFGGASRGHAFEERRGARRSAWPSCWKCHGSVMEGVLGLLAGASFWKSRDASQALLALAGKLLESSRRFSGALAGKLLEEPASGAERRHELAHL